VRVPLDYYRILGLPIQATADQLRQAHRDRTLQLPRREYSEAAITARKQLLDEAYGILSDAEQRKIYDTKFLTHSYDLESAADESESAAQASPQETAVDPYTPSIEIEDHQLVGALLILLELGEYELVLRMGRPYLTSGTLSLSNGQYGQPEIVRSDIVLTLAFACLELGREQWQQGQYENAAESLQTGQELLLQEGLFASIRGEMQADLFKLRPYRILELLAQPDENTVERRRGLTLLQDMLRDRGGIDGSGDDQSGLSVDDFLRFIQQLRSYLTAAEQQSLFESEARRPSAVATYLAVYALLARGFAERQPALVRRAKLMLVRLGTRQDVHLEQAICALLLGQTEEASRALELSQEYDSIAFIREHSQGSPDLLPGLCLYAERWLQNEVFPQFRDLADRQASLKEYFADEHVQSYLEELPNEPESANQWSMAAAQGTNGRDGVSPAVGGRTMATTSTTERSRFVRTSTAALLEDVEMDHLTEEAIPPAAERVSHDAPVDSPNGGASMQTGGGRSPQTYSHTNSNRRPGGPTPRVVQPAPGSRRIFAKRRTLRLDRVMFLLAVGFLGIGLLVFIGSRLTRLSTSNSPATEEVNLGLGAVARTLGEPLTQIEVPDAPLTEETASEIVEAWLQAKAAALGSDHQVDQLNQILTDPVLTQWRNRAEGAEADGWHVEYNHEVEINEVITTEDALDLAQVDATVAERANVYSGGSLDQEASYDSTLQVRYDLIREEGKWLIQDMTVLP
jgi:hypothetical protein